MQQVNCAFFGPADWKTNAKKEVADTPIPQHIYEELKKPDPKDKTKKIAETFFLTLVRGSLNELIELAGEDVRVSELVRVNFGNYELPSPKWVLMSKRVLEGSLNSYSLDHHNDLIRNYGTGFRKPEMLELVTGLVTHRLKYGKEEKIEASASSLCVEMCNHDEYYSQYVTVGHNQDQIVVGLADGNEKTVGVRAALS